MGALVRVVLLLVLLLRIYGAYSELDDQSTVEVKEGSDLQRTLTRFLSGSRETLNVALAMRVLELDKPIEIDLRRRVVNETVSININISHVRGGNLTWRCRSASSALIVVWNPQVRATLQADDKLFVENCKDSAVILRGASSMGLPPPCEDCQHRTGLQQMVFVNNTAGRGGGVRVEGGLWALGQITFKNNSATDGGALYVAKEGAVAIYESVFDSNRCENASLTAQYRTESCRAKHMAGGAMHIAHDGCLLDISQCQFSRNRATHAGALFIEDISPRCLDLIKFENPERNAVMILVSNFSHNTALCDGGVIWVNQTIIDTTRRYVRFQIDTSYFTNNKAYLRGGALYMHLDEGMLVMNTNFSQNSAGRGGGAIYFTTPFTGMATVNTSSFTENIVQADSQLVSWASDVDGHTAFTGFGSGGALLIEAKARGQLHLRENHFIRNGASFQGGAVALLGLHEVVLEGNNFSENQCVGSGAALSLKTIYGNNHIHNCHFTGNTAGSEVARLQLGMSLELKDVTPSNFTRSLLGRVMSSKRSSSPKEMRLGDWLLGPCGLGGGGAICLQNPGDVNVTNNTITKNSALFGGGMFLETGRCMDLYAIDSKEGQRDCTISFDTISNWVADNHAEFLGRQIFVTRLEPLTQVFNSCLDGATRTCPQEVLTRAQVIQVIRSDRQPVRAEEDFSLEAIMVDNMGSTVTSFDTDVDLRVESETTEVKFLEKVLPRMTPMQWPVVLNLTAHGVSGNHTLRVVAQQHGGGSLIATGNYDMSIRDCQVGEFLSFTSKDRAGQGIHLCTPCGNNSFSFNITQRCEQCPAHANCSNGSIIVPHDLYWHSHPRSPLMHRCPMPRACESHNSSVSRLEALLIWQKDHRSALGAYGTRSANEEEANVLIMDYRHRQCSEGHQGTLCGSCSSGWARASNRCTQCHSVMISWMLFILARALELLGIGGLVLYRFRKRLRVIHHLEHVKVDRDQEVIPSNQVREAHSRYHVGERGPVLEQPLVCVEETALQVGPEGSGTQLDKDSSMPLKGMSCLDARLQESRMSPDSSHQEQQGGGSLTSRASKGAQHAKEIEKGEDSRRMDKFWQLPALAVLKSLVAPPAPEEVPFDALAEVRWRTWASGRHWWPDEI